MTHAHEIGRLVTCVVLLGVSRLTSLRPRPMLSLEIMANPLVILWLDTNRNDTLLVCSTIPFGVVSVNIRPPSETPISSYICARYARSPGTAHGPMSGQTFEENTAMTDFLRRRAVARALSEQCISAGPLASETPTYILQSRRSRE